MNLFVIFLAAMTILVPYRTLHAAGTEERKPAPDFTLPDLNGKPVSMSSFHGKVIILDFWATWCPPCRAEIPHFKALYAAHQKQGLEVIGIAMDQDGASTVKTFVQAQGMTYPVLLGNQTVAAAYGGIQGIPTTFVIDRQGRIVQKYIGYQDKKVFEDAIRDFL